MTTAERLTWAALEHPEEDTPRLELADALSENGKPAAVARAELIRVQVELAQPITVGLEDLIHETRPGEAADTARLRTKPRREGLQFRQTALLRKWGAGWLPPTGRVSASACGFEVRGDALRVHTIGPEGYRFSRGFITEVRAECADHLPPNPGPCGKFVRELLASHPLERIVFAWEGHQPELTLRVEKMPIWVGSEWWAFLGRSEEIGRYAFNTGPHANRASLLRAIPGFVAARMPVFHFTETPQPIPF